MNNESVFVNLEHLKNLIEKMIEDGKTHANVSIVENENRLRLLGTVKREIKKPNKNYKICSA